MTKKIIATLLGIAAITGATLLYLSKPAEKSIAVVMTLSHPALQSVSDGFVDAIAKHDHDAKIVYFNAEGNVQQANLIAQKIAADRNIRGVLAIGTLAAQTIAKAETARPVVFAAVSDPNVLDATKNNLCGLSDAISPRYQVETILKLAPSVKRVALLYTPSEANSASMVKSLAEVLEAHAIATKLVGVHEPQQIMAASTAACTNNDAVLIPLDNQLVASMPTVIKATRSLPCLVITSNESPIHQGATMAFGVDYRKSGEDAGHIMASIIDGNRRSEDIGIVNPKKLDLFVNDKILDEKGITLDETHNHDLIHVSGANNG